MALIGLATYRESRRNFGHVFFLCVCVFRGLRQIPKRDLAPKDTVDESHSGSFLQAVDWKSGIADGPGPKPLTDR